MTAFQSVARIARPLAGLALIGAVTLGAACGEEDPEVMPAPAVTSAPVTTTSTPSPTAVAVTAVDFAFQGLPASVAPGTIFTLANRSAAELHELVAIRIPESERRPVSELIRLPEEELNAIFGDAPPATVIIAPPTQNGMAVVGDGSVKEAGRYAIVCFIPTGADPQEYLRAAQASTEGPPQVAGGAPHAANGMFAELTVR